jgi:hypothetical protein
MYNFICVRANLLCPPTEPIAVPFQIFLVVFRHMLHDVAVLPWLSVEADMRAQAVMVEENFNGFVCYPYIDLAFDIFTRTEYSILSIDI